MSLREKLQEFGAKKNAKKYITRELEDIGILEFEISPITLGEHLSFTASIPSYHAIMLGRTKIEVDEDGELKDTSHIGTMLEAANFAVIQAVRVREVDSEEWTEFNQVDLVPRDILPSEFLMKLYELVTANFRV